MARVFSVSLLILLCGLPRPSFAEASEACVEYSGLVSSAVAMKHNSMPQQDTVEMMLELYHVYGPGGIVLRYSQESAELITRLVQDVYDKNTSRIETRDGIDILRSECMNGDIQFGRPQ